MIQKWLNNDTRPTLVCVILSGIALVLSLAAHFHPIPAFSVFDPAWAAAVLCGVPIVFGAAQAIVTEQDITADLLVSLALIASLITREWFAAGEVAFIMQIGSLLEDYTSERARRGVEALINLTPKTARRVTDGAETVIPVEQIQIGDTLRVLAGETIPVDGTIVAGSSAVNQAAMTGESIPVEKAAGDAVLSGTVNQQSPIDIRAERESADSTLQRMIDLAREADANKAPIVGLADKWAAWMVLVALSCAVVVGLLTHQFSRAVTVLVVFCPCAFVLATPTAVAAAIGNLTRYGVLVKSGDALERIAGVDTIAFDKTGTLTEGTPAVMSVVSLKDGVSEKAVLAGAAALERYSEHPLGKAITAHFKETDGGALPDCEDVEVLQGKGIQGKVDGKTLFVGKAALFDDVAHIDEIGPFGVVPGKGKVVFPEAGHDFLGFFPGVGVPLIEGIVKLFKIALQFGAFVLEPARVASRPAGTVERVVREEGVDALAEGAEIGVLPLVSVDEKAVVNFSAYRIGEPVRRAGKNGYAEFAVQLGEFVVVNFAWFQAGLAAKLAARGDLDP